MRTGARNFIRLAEDQPGCLNGEGSSFSHSNVAPGCSVWPGRSDVSAAGGPAEAVMRMKRSLGEAKGASLPCPAAGFNANAELEWSEKAFFHLNMALVSRVAALGVVGRPGMVASSSFGRAVTAIEGTDRPVRGLSSSFYIPVWTRQLSVQTGEEPVHTGRHPVQTRQRPVHNHNVQAPKRSVQAAKRLGRRAKRLGRRAKRHFLWLGRLDCASKRRIQLGFGGKRCRST
jgi:hypothetical protein